jgi:hypothetical protein
MLAGVSEEHVASILRLMAAICSSETSVDFQRTTQRSIPEDSTLHNNRCETLKSYIYTLIQNHTRVWLHFHCNSVTNNMS